MAEALTNVAKYARRRRATRQRRAVTHDLLVVEVATTASAAPTPARGSGLRGLADRVDGLDGSLDVEARRAAGTTGSTRSCPCAS